MPFWDRFVGALYFGLAPYLPAGREAALRILGLAVTRNRLSLAELSDTSLLLLLGLLPADSPHRAAVQSLAAGRKIHLNPNQIVGLLHSAAPPRLIDLLELGREPGTHPGTVALLLSLTAPELLHLCENLCLFLGRLYLVDPGNAQLRAIARALVTRAAQEYAQTPAGDADYLALLYRIVQEEAFSQTHPLPAVLSASSQPAWFQPLAAAEREFINACLRDLAEPAVNLMYLHLYARLNAGQIAHALHLPDPEDAVEAVADQIEEAWDVIL